MTTAHEHAADEAGVATWCKLGYSARAAEENCLGSPEDDFWNEGRCAAGLPVCFAADLHVADSSTSPEPRPSASQKPLGAFLTDRRECLMKCLIRAGELYQQCR